MSSEELKLCPFCGSSNLTVLGYGIELDSEHPSERPHAVVCESCGCAGEEVAPRSVAIEAWNRRAPLAAIHGGMGEVVEVVGYAGRYQLELRHLYPQYPGMKIKKEPNERYTEALMTVAQHQRITAAMAAEVERLSRMLNNATNDGIKLADERDALRAELAEVKGREAVGEVQLRTGGGISLLHVDLTQPLPPGAKLYALPPASPDVEGLVRALEQAIADIEDWAAYASPYFQEKHDLAGCLEKHRTALSTWRQRTA